MYKYLLKYKWYAVTVAGAILVVILIMFNLQDDFANELNTWLFKKREKIINDDLKYRKKKLAQTDEEIEKVDEKIKSLKKDREETNKAIDKKDLKEMDDAWKRLGY